MSASLNCYSPEYDITDLIHVGDFEEAWCATQRFEGHFVECDNPAHQICYGFGREELLDDPVPRLRALTECLTKLDGNQFARDPNSAWNLLATATRAGDVDTVRFLLLMGWPMSGSRGKRFVANGQAYIDEVERDGPSDIYVGFAYWRDGRYLKDLKRAQKAITRARREAVRNRRRLGSAAHCTV